MAAADEKRRLAREERAVISANKAAVDAQIKLKRTVFRLSKPLLGPGRIDAEAMHSEGTLTTIVELCDLLEYASMKYAA